MVYPRAGGETDELVVRLSKISGLSPRGRGNRSGHDGVGRLAGSIPARAGKPCVRQRHLHPRRVYPRAGGETPVTVSVTREPDGLSPRGRGNRDVRVPVDPDGGSIPARAGKPPDPPGPCRIAMVYPRAGGETPDHDLRRADFTGLSPRGRGNRIQQLAVLYWRWSIPARAGKPPSGDCLADLSLGLSPRGRGNRIEPASSIK